MRYHYIPSVEKASCMRSVDKVNHPLFNFATVFISKNGKGLFVIQQRFNPKFKLTWWGGIDSSVAFDILANERYEDLIEKYGGEADTDGFYPYITVRRAMWFLRMKPLPKEVWETTFA